MHCHNRVHQNLLLFSLKCLPNYPGKALRLRTAYDTLMAAMVVAGIVS